MLETVGSIEIDQDIYRLARTPQEWAFLNRIGLTPRELAEAESFFGANPLADFDQLIEEPFRGKTNLGSTVWRDGRFSDGSWPVFYAAADPNTAVAELCHHRKREWTSGNYPKGSPYCVWLFSCWLSAHAKDLSAITGWHAQLTDEKYEFCRDLGREASRDGIDAFKTPSARAPSGVNNPTFKRSCLAKLQILKRARFTFDETTGVSVELTKHN